MSAIATPLSGQPTLDDDEREFWCKCYLAYMALPPGAYVTNAEGGRFQGPGIYADGAIMELRDRTGKPRA